MINKPDFGNLLRKSLVFLLLGAVLFLLCYWFVDRPVALYVYEQQFAKHDTLKWLTYLPPLMQAWAPVVIAALMVRRAWGPFLQWERVLVAAAVGMIVADQFRQSLSYVFGRYWPETWIDDNKSFIRDGAYGFHPFHGGSAYGSYPSGHAARTMAVAVVVWIAYPKTRWVCVIACVAEAGALIGMNYHFVGDVIAGGLVGGIVGAWTFIFFNGGSTTIPQE